MRLPGLIAASLAFACGTTYAATGTDSAVPEPVQREIVRGRYRFTDVWVLRAGAWQCVATQETHVP